MKLTTPVFIVVLLLGLASTCLFTVYHTHEAFVLRFNKRVLADTGETKVYKSGLHFKIPFIDRVVHFDKRLLLFGSKSPRIKTKEKKDVEVSFYVLWKIEDLDKFYQSTRGRYSDAEERLKNKILNQLNVEFGKRTIREVVSDDREDLMLRLRRVADGAIEDMGIAVEDVRIKRIEFPDTVRKSVFDRMIAERSRKAKELRGEGEKDKVTIMANADSKARIVISKAHATANKIKGEGDAKAAEIYAKAYNQDADFYEFYRSLQAYKKSFNSKNDILVLKPDSEFFKYFANSKG